VVDERVLVRVQDGVTRVVANSVLSASFAREAGQSRIQIDFELAKSLGSTSEPLHQSTQSTVVLFNR
jgi:hypothetical protein